MAPPDLFDERPAGTREAIMRATYRALCRHGYADLTIQRIGDEFEKSKSLLYHHYGGKDDLLVEFLEYMLERFEGDVPRDEYPDAAAHLSAVLDHVFPAALSDDRVEFTTAIVELRAQAAHKPAYREHFTRSDRFFHDRLRSIVRDGIEEGVFRDVDPDRAAALLLTTITGAMVTRATTADDAHRRAVREELAAYVEARLLADGEDGP